MQQIALRVQDQMAIATAAKRAPRSQPDQPSTSQWPATTSSASIASSQMKAKTSMIDGCSAGVVMPRTLRPPVMPHNGVVSDTVIDKAQSSIDAWEAIWSVIDDLTSDTSRVIDPHLEAGLAAFIYRASDEGLIDRELHIEATSRWMLALVDAYRSLIAGHATLDPDTEIATMRLIITRYLRPARTGI